MSCQFWRYKELPSLETLNVRDVGYYPFHQGGETLITQRIARDHLPNAVGNLAQRAVTFDSLVFGGV